MKKASLYTLLIVLSHAVNLNAQFKLKQDSIQKRSFIALPYGSYSEETSWSAGVAANYYFWNKNELNRVSTLAFNAAYTLNNQIIFGVYNRYYFNNDYYIYGRIIFQKYPDYFYGIGNNTLDENKESFTPLRYHFNIEPQKFINETILVGVSIQSRYEKINTYADGGNLKDLIIPGSEPYALYGLGGIFAIDSRDNNYYPSKGIYFKTSLNYFMPVFNSNYNYVDIKSDFRYFHTIKEKIVLANQVVAQYQTAEAPFQMTPTFGGLDVLRGYRSGQYRDKLFMMEQFEVRFPIYKRISGATFAAVGNVWNGFNSLNLKNIKFAAGAGIRFRINDAKINLRGDGALTRDGKPGYYLTSIEAF